MGTSPHSLASPHPLHHAGDEGHEGDEEGHEAPCHEGCRRGGTRDEGHEGYEGNESDEEGDEGDESNEGHEGHEEGHESHEGDEGHKGNEEVNVAVGSASLLVVFGNGHERCVVA